eukprot:4167774-Amphidinium_carterae.1
MLPASWTLLSTCFVGMAPRCHRIGAQSRLSNTYAKAVTELPPCQVWRWLLSIHKVGSSPSPQPSHTRQIGQAGLTLRSQDRERFEADHRRFPMAHYAAHNLVWDGDHGHPLNSKERETIMGFPPGYTSALCENDRCSAMGNTFH